MSPKALLFLLATLERYVAVYMLASKSLQDRARESRQETQVVRFFFGRQ